MAPVDDRLLDEVHGYQTLQSELDSYVAFFKKRTEIEQEYAEALLKLSYKQPSPGEGKRAEDETPKAAAGSGETTWRKAWSAAKTATTDEAVTHRNLSVDFSKITADLVSFRDDKDRMRRRVKDDVRAATTEHMSYLSEVGKLRKTYERRVEEVQAHEEAESAREQQQHDQWPPGHWSDSEGSGRSSGGRGRSHSTASSGGRDRDQSPPPIHSPPLTSPPATGGPTVFISGATSSGASSNAYRDAPAAGGKGGNVFDVISKRDWSGEKKSLNSIVRAVRDRVGEGSGQGQLKPSMGRGAKARQVSSQKKREAEQADRDYRNGIFRLETLRLQRNRLNKAAAKSLEEFAGELSSKVKQALKLSIDARLKAGNQRVHTVQDLLPMVNLINPVADEDNFKAQLRNAAPPEPKVYYVNAFVGECRTLLFGVSLQDYLATHPERPVPLIVQTCVKQIEETGLDCEGIYRIPGKLATVQQLVHAIEKNEDSFQFDPREEPATVAGVLKLYLRQLPFPLFPWPAADRVTFSSAYGNIPDVDLYSIAKRIRRLSPAHRATLQYLCEHLARVAEHEATNMMNPSNLGTCLTPAVLGEDEAATLESAMHKDIIMELLIKHHAVLFDDSFQRPPAVDAPPQPEPSLPPRLSTTPPALPNRPTETPQPVSPVHAEPPALPRRPVDQPQLQPDQHPDAAPPTSDAILVPPPALVPHPPPFPPVLPSLKLNTLQLPALDVSPTLSPTPSEPSPATPSSFSGSSTDDSDSVMNLYGEAEQHFNLPSPPLSAAEGRHIPVEGSQEHRRTASDATVSADRRSNEAPPTPGTPGRKASE
ncbi:hypothetical protein RQP46_007190 [Phenoliferia psychrophenolica]